MLLRLATWKQVEDYLTIRTDVLVPLGSTEQHGPNGLLGTDHLTAEEIAREVGDDHGVLVAPTLAYGMSEHHLAFPGTLSLRPMTLVAVLRDVALSFHRHGFTRVFFVNGHGGNVSTARAAFSGIHADCSVRCRLVSWYELPEVVKAKDELFGVREGNHATPGEISVTMKFYPHAIDAVGPCEVVPGMATPIYSAEDFRRRYPDGRMNSDPSLASTGAGERLFAAACEGVARELKAFVEEA